MNTDSRSAHGSSLAGGGSQVLDGTQRIPSFRVCHFPACCYFYLHLMAHVACASTVLSVHLTVWLCTLELRATIVMERAKHAIKIATAL